MRAREFLPESWFKDLDPNHLRMAGYTEDPQEDPKREDLKSTVKDIRRSKRVPVTPRR